MSSSSAVHSSPGPRLRTISSSFRHLTGMSPHGHDHGDGLHDDHVDVGGSTSLYGSHGHGNGHDLAVQLNDWANDAACYDPSAPFSADAFDGFASLQMPPTGSSEQHQHQDHQHLLHHPPTPTSAIPQFHAGDMDEFGQFGHHQQQHMQHGLGFDMDVDPAQQQLEFDNPQLAHLSGNEVLAVDTASPHRTRARASKHAHPYSSLSSSPARSRSGSIRGIANLSITTPSPGSTFSFGGLPSPFRQPSSPTHSTATMDPAQSVRSSSPSETSSSSISGQTMSRMGSSSAASSVYGGEPSSSTGPPATPYRNSAPGSSGSLNSRASRPTHARRLSASPVKGSRNAKKLTDQDRKAICVFRELHPTTKQDDIGLRFGVERSTVSKILKLKDKWLNIPDSNGDEEVEPASRSASTAPLASSTSHSQLYQRETSETPEPASAATPVQSPPSSGTAHQHSTSSSSSSGTYLIAEEDENEDGEDFDANVPRVNGGRYPDVDNKLAQWARSHLAHGYGPLSDELLQTKAREIAARVTGNARSEFKASHTWLDGFKHRAGISAGVFVDMLSPASKARAEFDAAVARDGRFDGREEDDIDEEDGEGVFLHALDRRTRRSSSRGTRRQAALASSVSRRQAPTPDSSSSTGSSRPGTATNKMAVDGSGLGNGTPSRTVYDSEATPTHSTVHSRATSAAAEQRLFDEMYSLGSQAASANAGAGDSETREQQQGTIRRSSTMSSVIQQQQQQSSVHATPSRRSSTQTSPNLLSNYSPSDVSAPSAYPSYPAPTGLPSSYSTSDLTSYPLQSPFQTSSSGSSFAQYANGSHPGSGTSSPVPSYAHGRSGSTASTTSSYSGLTAFSSQNGNGTPLTGSLYGSFPNSQSQPNSVPSTPSGGGPTGYFGHGPDGTQSQLQAAFLGQQSQPSSPFPSYGGKSTMAQQRQQPIQPQQQQQPQQQAPQLGQPAQPARRATISGGAPFSAMAQSLSQQGSSRKSSQHVSLEQARASLETAFDYLKSAEAQGFAEPKDLLVIWELKEKMAAVHKKQQQQQQQAGGAAGLTASPAAAALGSNNARFNFTAQSLSGSGAGPQRRIKLGRTQSASSIASLGTLYGRGEGSGSSSSSFSGSAGLGRRNGSAVSLFDHSMGVMEEQR